MNNERTRPLFHDCWQIATSEYNTQLTNEFCNILCQAAIKVCKKVQGHSVLSREIAQIKIDKNKKKKSDEVDRWHILNST